MRAERFLGFFFMFGANRISDAGLFCCRASAGTGDASLAGMLSSE
jgi:hypothetical protein